MDRETELPAFALARLMATPAKDVLAMLEADAADGAPWRRRSADKALEEALLSRNEKLIDLGLARYGADLEVVGALCRRAREASDDRLETTHRAGLLAGCYANRQVDPGPDGLLVALLGEEAAQEAVQAAELEALAPLLANPRAGDRFLWNLYTRTGLFAGLEEDRWASLIELAADNPRLLAERPGSEGADLAFRRIHEAIYRLVNTAPIGARWYYVLRGTIWRLAPPATVVAEPAAKALDRWRGLELQDAAGEVMPGDYTPLTLAGEFRVLLASVYGCRRVADGYELAGGPESGDIADRCAFYANALFGARAAAQYFERDGSAFALALLHNHNPSMDAVIDGFVAEHVSDALLLALHRDMQALRAVRGVRADQGQATAEPEPAAPAARRRPSRKRSPFTLGSRRQAAARAELWLLVAVPFGIAFLARMALGLTALN